MPTSRRHRTSRSSPPARRTISRRITSGGTTRFLVQPVTRRAGDVGGGRILQGRQPRLGRRGQRPQRPPAVFYLHSDRAHSCPGNRAVPRPAHLCRREVGLPPAAAPRGLAAPAPPPPRARGGARVVLYVVGDE